jgi:hypothetical protein
VGEPAYKQTLNPVEKYFMQPGTKIATVCHDSVYENGIFISAVGHKWIRGNTARYARGFAPDGVFLNSIR